jgi:hypothetical protein
VRRPRARLVLDAAKGLLLIGALAAAGWTSCFFDPRDAELGTPLDTTATRYRPAFSPEILVNNIRVTFEDRQITFYALAFSESFLFRADPLDSADEANADRNTFEGWDEEVERATTDKIFNTADRIAMTLSDLVPPVAEIGPDTARIRKIYEFSVVSVESIAPDTVLVDSAVYKGTLTFFMNQPGSDWVLYRWEDARPPEPGIPSWGQLRARNK